MISFEDDNSKAYVLLLRIEIALRELLRNSMKSELGVTWSKRLPGDMLKKIKESQTEENRRKFGYVRLGPLYYLTFGELLTLLKQKPGHPVAEKLGGKHVLAQLEDIFVARNAVCHSRPVSSPDLQQIETLLGNIETALGAAEFARLIAKPDVGLTQDQAANGLILALKEVLHALPELPPSFAIPDVIQDATNQFWWADDLLAGFNRSIIETAILVIREYNALPAGVGSAGARQGFIDQRMVSTRVLLAIGELENRTL